MNDHYPLLQAFRNPPASVRPWVRWWWFGNAATPEEIDRELSFIARSGWGGVELQCVYSMPDVPNGPDLLSDEWVQLVEIAADKAKRYGLGFDLTFGSGWPFGGAHIPPDAQAVTIRGLSQAVLVPTGESDIQHALLSRLILPEGLKPGEKVVCCQAAPVITPGIVPLIDSNQTISLNLDALLETLSNHHPVMDEAEQGALWSISWVIQSPTNQKVKRVAPGGEGYVHDHLSQKGFDAHSAAWGDALRKKFTSHLGEKIRAIFCDSYEVAGIPWTDEFPQWFQRTCGYNLLPYLPFLLRTWQIPESLVNILADVRYDYRKVVANRVMEGFYEPFVRWAHAHGVQARIQAHGSPTDWLVSYGAADIPETEAILIPIEATRLAASAARLYGTQPVTSESFTCLYHWPDVKMFAERPDDLKAIADAQFACGLQQVFYHGYAYSPPEAGEFPGWRFYASIHANHTTPWRDGFPDLNAYLSRMSVITQAGYAMIDFALYQPLHDRWCSLPDEAENYLSWKHEDGQFYPSPNLQGYSFDWMNDDVLLGAELVDQQMVVGHQRYKALVLDHIRCLPLKTAKRILQLVESGFPLILLGEPPSHIPGLAENQQGTDIQSIFSSIITRKNLPVYRSLESYQAAGGIPPDVIDLNQPMQPLWWFHRKVGDQDIYFIANPEFTKLTYPLPYKDGAERDQSPIELDLRLRGEYASCEAWDAENGGSRPVQIYHQNGFTLLRLTFSPNQSHLLVFSPFPQQPESPLHDEKGYSTGEVTCPWEITCPWKITLPDQTSVRLEKLVDWRDIPSLRDYSGSLCYSAEIPIDQPSAHAVLDLGLVEITAEVWINHHYAGRRLWSPYQFNIGEWLKPGRNLVEVKVTNLLYNAVQGKYEQIGTHTRTPGLTNNEWRGIIAQGYVEPISERRPSGLLGPIVLRV
ncbi:MAG TPA: glycosyl hydrolase [Anaerolineaceae bacterium]